MLSAGTEARAIDGLPGYTVGEMRHLARSQRVSRLEDVILRRTLIALEGRCSLSALRAIAGAIGPELGWDLARQDQEVRDTLDLLARRHGVKIPQDQTLPQAPAVTP